MKHRVEETSQILHLHRQNILQAQIALILGLSECRVRHVLRLRWDEPAGLNCGRAWRIMQENGKSTKEEVREWLKGMTKWENPVAGMGPATFMRLKRWSNEVDDEPEMAMTPAKPEDHKTLWAVLKMLDWSSLSVAGMTLVPPHSGPIGFIPIFRTREQAVAWSNGKEENIRKITVNAP